MEDTSLNKEGSGNKRGRPRKTNYQGNKNITLIKTEIIKDKEYYHQWIQDNRVEFFNASPKSKKFVTELYEAYNFLYGTNKQPGKCGICDYNIILEIKRLHF